MRWATELINRATRFSTFQLVGDGRQSKHVQTPPHSQQFGIIADDAIAYPQLLEDLDLLLRLLQDLHDDLTSANETIERHGHGLDQLSAAMHMLSDRACPNRLRDQFIADLEVVFEQLRNVEDDLTSCLETITLHGFKLQHLDLAMQMLAEVFEEVVVGGGARSTSISRLQRLRLACGQALNADEMPVDIEKGF